MFVFQSWIISYFSRIHGFHVDPAYVDAMPRAARYALQRGNDAVGPYRLYMDRTMHDDVTWRPFVNYAQIVPFDGIALYSGWLACGTGIMVRYLPEQCMRQFGFVQRIPRSLLKEYCGVLFFYIVSTGIIAISPPFYSLFCL